MNLNDLARHNKKAIQAAGPRYTPGLDPSAPNIRLDDLVESIDALALTDGFRRRIGRLHADLKSAYHRNRRAVGDSFRSRSVTLETLMGDVERLASLARPHAVKRQVGTVLRHARLVVTAVDAETERIDKSRSELTTGEENDKTKEKLRELDNRGYQIYQLRASVQAVRSFLAGTGQLATDRQQILLLGTWGTGKTHLMCDVALNRLDGTVPALLFLASTLDSPSNVLDAMAVSSGLAPNGTELLRRLNSLGAIAGRRALLLIDGVNEGDHEAWRRSLGPLAQKISRFKHLGLIVSCRRPYEQQLLTRVAEKRYVQVEHRGFANQEFDVQLEFFQYYELEAPEVPLITSEFSNPLFLKLFCKAIQDLSARTQKRKFHELASGQETINYIFEYFAKRVGRPIEADFGLQGRAPCWELLKSFAERMVQTSTESLPIEDAVDLASLKCNLTRIRATALINRMAVEGLLLRQMHWRDEAKREAVHFPFQRFGDHLMARYLLQANLDRTNDQSVRRSFYGNRPLGKVFVLDQWGREFSSPGLAEALMVEFPERVKRSPLSSTELVWFLPKRCRYASPLARPFLDGLYWRSASSFTGEVDRLIKFLLDLDSEDIRARTLDTLVGLAARPGHPYSARRLQAYLFGLSMQDRDLRWSEYIRLSDENGPFHRVIAWTTKSGSLARETETIRNDVTLLSLGLPTTDRPLRDRITRALVQLGCRDPNSLFTETVKALECNDPYVPERMLAAAYGVAMQLWSDPDGGELRSDIIPFARRLIQAMFVPGAPHATAHTLMRDYATGIIDLALRVSPRSLATQQLHFVRSTTEAFPSPFVDSDTIKSAEVEVDSGALHMDFENYTLGRLIPGRGNYDNKHAGYRQVRKQILKRMQDLGYMSKSFDEIDKRIAQYNFRGRDEGKTDRYGKKYSWIAFFEMFGYRDAHALLDEEWPDERTSDCDIDPSFPEPAQAWKPTLPDYFARSPRGAIEWLRNGPNPNYNFLLRTDQVDGQKGPWILIDGHVTQEGTHSRQLFTFLQTIFAPERSVPRIREYVEGKRYLGNHALPSSSESYYTFAGEIPWSPRYGHGHLLADGRPRRHLQPIFHEFQNGHWVSGLKVEVPTHHWIWESHHSTLNQVSGVRFPTPALCESLGLVNHRGTFDLFDRGGRRASIYRVWPPERGSYFGSYVLYLREDLARKYLQSTSQTLIWVPWGERNVWRSGENFDRLSPGHSAAFQEYANVHRRFVAYE
jgi:hypothetical protein